MTHKETVSKRSTSYTGVGVAIGANGTCMRWSWDLKPKGALELMGPIMAMVGRRNEKANWTSLKHFLEAGSADPAGTAIETQPTNG